MTTSIIEEGTRKLIAKALKDLLEAKEAHIIEEFTKLVELGVIWTEEDKGHSGLLVRKQAYSETYEMSQKFAFRFDGYGRIKELESRVKELEAEKQRPPWDR